jgi:hypothetical protein
MLSTKRKSVQSNPEPKKLKTNHSSISNGENQQPVVDCRQMPFKGIEIKT